MRTTTWKFIINEENKPVLAFTNRSHLTCDCCKNPIYYENEEYEQDPCYQLDDGTTLCEECLDDYIKDRFYLSLQERREVF